MLNTTKRKMCECANIDFESVNWQDGSHLNLEWTKEQEESFRQWMVNELMTSRLYRQAFTKYPNLAKGKFRATKMANEFIWNYGFKTT